MFCVVSTSVNWNTQAATVSNTAPPTQQQPLHTPQAPSLHSGTVSDMIGLRNTAVACHGPAKHVTTILPTDENSAEKSLPVNLCSKVEHLPSHKTLDSSSSHMFVSSTDPVPAVRSRSLATSWRMPVRGLAEPSPVATVRPQRQMAVARSDHQPSASNLSHPRGLVAEHPLENLTAASETLSDRVGPQRWRRKRKRRLVYGTRRRRKKTQQNTSAATSGQPAEHSPASVDVTVVTSGNATGVTDVFDTGVEVARNSSLANSGVLGATKPAGAGHNTPTTSCMNQKQALASAQKVLSTSDTNRPTVAAAQSASNPSVGTVRRALKPIENQQQGRHFFTNDVGRPSVLQKDALGATAPTSIGRNTPTTSYQQITNLQLQRYSDNVQNVPTNTHNSRLLVVNRSVPRSVIKPAATYNKQQQPIYFANVQKVATTSTSHDIYEYCGEDDDEPEHTAARPTPKSYRSTPVQSVQQQCFTSSVDPTGQKRVKFGNSATPRRLR